MTSCYPSAKKERVTHPILPPALRPGATIGIVAPARWPLASTVKNGVAWLENQGFKVRPHPHLTARDGRLAGSDTIRAEALAAMVTDDSVDAILCARGGSGSFRILEHVDFDMIRRHPKIICGFSDQTTLLNAITRRTGLVTFHGPMLRNLADPKTDPKTGQDWIDILSGKAPRDGKFFSASALVPGQAQGRLIGGNLNLLRNFIGTADDWSGEGKILFIEDIDEPLYKIDHMLWQLRAAGKFSGLKGVIVGHFVLHPDDHTPSTDPDDPPYNKPLPDLLRQYLPPGIPVCTDFPCGHTDYLTTLPLGVMAAIEVTAAQTKLRLLEPVVRT